MRLAGKTALITGARQGIGRAAAELFAREGAAVSLVDIDEAGASVADSIRSQGGRALFFRGDVSDPIQVQQTVKGTVEAFGALHILYNNAGGSIPSDNVVTECDDESFWRTIQVNLYGTWLFCKHAIPEIARAGGGSVINTSSMTALRGFPSRDAYVCSKGAIGALTRSMAVKHGPDNIRVNTIAPGLVLSERGQEHLRAGILPQQMLDRHVVGPLEPIQIAQAALFLASDDASGITGQMIPVDSGYTIG